MREIKFQSRQLWSETRWILLGIFWLAGFLLGYAGFAEFARDNAHDWSAAHIFYLTLQLVVLESGSVSGKFNWMLDTARFLLPALTAFTAAQAVMDLFHEQTQWLRLWRLRDHVVVCGLGRKGSHLVAELLAQGRQVVAVEKDPNHKDIRQFRRRGGIVLIGDATDAAILTSARIQRARHLICLLNQDGSNLQAAVQAYGLSRGRSRGRLTCVINLDSADLVDLIKHSELAIDPTDSFEIETFNAYARAARLMLQSDTGWQADPAGEAPRRILVIGMGRLGENLVRQAGYTWHLLKRQEALQITVLDIDAEKKVSALLRKFPQFQKSCQLTPLQMDLSEFNLLHERLLSDPINGAFQRVYICLNDPVISLQVCLNLVRLSRIPPAAIQVRLEGDSELSEFVRNPLPGLADANRVRTFDLYEQTCSADLLVSGTHELLARDLHAVYLRGSGDPFSNQEVSLPWEQLPEETKEANRRQASRIHQLLEAAGYRINPLQDWDAAERQFTADEILLMARLEHNLWRQAKEAEGWRHGAQRDNKRRTNPDLVGWESLNDNEKEKNIAFVRQLPALLAQAGFQIDRMKGAGDGA